MENITMVVIPQEEWANIKNLQLQILQQIKELQNKSPFSRSAARTTFDELVSANKRKGIKKKRKIYLSGSEVERYFNDNSIP